MSESTLQPQDARKFLLNHLSRLPFDAQWDLTSHAGGARGVIRIPDWMYEVTASNASEKGVMVLTISSPSNREGLGSVVVGNLTEATWTKVLEHIVAHFSTQATAAAWREDGGTITVNGAPVATDELNESITLPPAEGMKIKSKGD